VIESSIPIIILDNKINFKNMKKYATNIQVAGQREGIKEEFCFGYEKIEFEEIKKSSKNGIAQKRWEISKIKN